MGLAMDGNTNFAMIENMVTQGGRLKAGTIKYSPEHGLEIIGACSTMPDPTKMATEGAIADGTYDYVYSFHLVTGYTSRSLRLVNEPIAADATFADYAGPVSAEILKEIQQLEPTIDEAFLGYKHNWDKGRKFSAYKYASETVGEKVNCETDKINMHPANNYPCVPVAKTKSLGGSDGCLLFTPSNEKRIFRGLEYNPNRAKSGTITIDRSFFGDGTGGVNNYSVDVIIHMQIFSLEILCLQ